jgi:hypothetical protein
MVEHVALSITLTRPPRSIDIAVANENRLGSWIERKLRLRCFRWDGISWIEKVGQGNLLYECWRGVANEVGRLAVKSLIEWIHLGIGPQSNDSRFIRCQDGLFHEGQWVRRGNCDERARCHSRD